MLLKTPRYTASAHAERVRALLVKRIGKLPLPALVRLQEVAALLEAGESLEVLGARELLGRRKEGAVQVQGRRDIERGQAMEAKGSARKYAAELAADAAASRFTWHRKRRPGTSR